MTRQTCKNLLLVVAVVLSCGPGSSSGEDDGGTGEGTGDGDGDDEGGCDPNICVCDMGGQQAWSVTFDDHEPIALAPSDSGGVVVGGALGERAWLRNVDDEGVTVWDSVSDETGWVNDVVRIENNEFMFTGTVEEEPGQPRAFIAKAGPDGDLSALVEADLEGESVGISILAESASDVVIAYWRNPFQEDSDIVVRAQGAAAWSDTFDVGLNDQPGDMVWHGDDIVVVGRVGDMPNTNAFVRRYSGDGAVEWTKVFENQESGNDMFQAASVRDGRLLVIGQDAESISESAVWIAELDDSGEVVWEERLEQGGNELSFGFDAEWTGGLEIAFAARYGANAEISKLDAQRDVAWMTSFQEASSGTMRLAVGSCGEAFVASDFANKLILIHP